MPQLLEAYRTGGGVAWSAYGPDMIEAQGDFNRPWLVDDFGDRDPARDPDDPRTTAADPPARVADVACGVGWAAISIARSYSDCSGRWLRPGRVVRRARARQRASGRCRRPCPFEVRDVAEVTASAYDVASIIEAIHDMTQPVEVLQSVHRMLAAGRPRCSSPMSGLRTRSRRRADELERLYYGFSIFTCLPAAMTETPTAALGTVMRASTMRELAAQAGFHKFERIDEPALDALRFYRLTP